MKKIILIAIAILPIISCSQKTEINTLTKQEKKESWALLFDGKTTNGWRIFKGGEVDGWKIEDGVLYNSGIGSDHGGDIITDNTYKDFELYLEWKINPSSNSGVFYHVEELDSVTKIYETGPEYQLVDESGRKLNPLQSTGANYAMNPPQNAKVKPTGEWNQTRIIVQGNHVEHWLNGVKVVEYEWWSPDWVERKHKGKWKDYPYYGLGKEGHIGLQDHGGLTGFRNIKIRRL